MKDQHKHFYRDIIQALQEDRLALFAGAGLSVGAGYVNWKELLKEIADEIGLDITIENDLISLAQYHTNQMGGRSKINQKILQEFSDKGEYTEAHRILSRLPVSTYWTTNYDKLIERGLEDAKRIYDVKHTNDQLHLAKPKRDAVVYKMHGDVDHATKAVITKDDYEKYYVTHQPFITTLSSDLISKTFLFVGFSFTDPNLDYILSRIRINFNGNQRHHYYFIKKASIGDYGIKDQADLDYALKKQQFFIQDLKRFQLIPVEVDSYEEITAILREIEFLFKKKTVFIAGSAESFGGWQKEDAQEFVHNLSKRLIAAGFRVVNGFGWGIGSAVINGALDQIYSNPARYSIDQLILRPFPQYATGGKELPELWHEYRQSMLAYAGIAIYLFGNKKDKKDETKVIPADGIWKEFEIAHSKGIINVPVKATGYVAEEIADKMQSKGYSSGKNSEYDEAMKKLYVLEQPSEILNQIIHIVNVLNK